MAEAAPVSNATPSTLTGRIDQWDRQKGYGYVVTTGRRVFLHIRDFKEHHKAPEVADLVTFELGTDQKGRTCAKQAVHVGDGGRFRTHHFLVVAALLIAPCLAAWRFGWLELRFVGGGYLGISALTYFLYSHDKRRANTGGWRVPENTLHLFELLGGWPGGFLAQRRFRHKCTKLSYQFVFWLIVALHQFVAVDSMVQWRGTHAVIETIGDAWIQVTAKGTLKIRFRSSA